MILLSTATRSSKFSVSTMHLTKRWHLRNTEKQNLTLSELLNQIFFHENPSSMQILALSPESQVWISVITSCTCSSCKVKGGFGRNEPAKPKKIQGKSAQWHWPALTSQTTEWGWWCDESFSGGLGSSFPYLPWSTRCPRAQKAAQPWQGQNRRQNKNCVPIKTDFCLCIKMLFLPFIMAWYFTNPIPPHLLQNSTFGVLQYRRKYIFILIKIVILKQHFQIRKWQRSQFNFLKG